MSGRLAGRRNGHHGGTEDTENGEGNGKRNQALADVQELSGYLLNAYSTMFSDSLSASSSCIMHGEP